MFFGEKKKMFNIFQHSKCWRIQDYDTMMVDSPISKCYSPNWTTIENGLCCVSDDQREFHTCVAVFLPTARNSISLHKALNSLYYKSNIVKQQEQLQLSCWKVSTKRRSRVTKQAFKCSKQLVDCYQQGVHVSLWNYKLTEINFHVSDSHLRRCLQPAVGINIPQLVISPFTIA